MKAEQAVYLKYGLLVILVLAICLPSEAQVYSISGTDNRLGPYTGMLEVRQGEGGKHQIIRLINLQDYFHHDGRGIDLVWTGTVQDTDGDAITALFMLRRADFITQVGDLVRSEAEATPLAVIATATSHPSLGIAINYRAPADPGFAIHETAVLLGPSGEEPIWRSDRFVRETHAAPRPVEKALLFHTFKSYHALPAVRTFTNHPQFNRAVHFQAIERTDFAYYRTNPDRLRVVNKVVDAISLAETEIYANAFRASFATKAEFYQKGLTEEFVGPHGMVVFSIAANGAEEPDENSTLWTGVYTMTQALRYQATGEQEALNNLRHSLTAILTLMDITEDRRTFARTLRLAGPPLTGGWRRGGGEFAHLDWRAGGNNDMSKGLLLGMMAGWQVLPEGDPLRREIQLHALELLELCPFLADHPPECGADDAELALPSVNPGAAWLLAGITNGDPALLGAGLQWLRQPLLFQYPDLGGGPFYDFGISDWSGNHLTLVTTLVLQWLLARTHDTELKDKWTRASAKAWDTLRKLEHPLHAALAVMVNAFDNPAARAEATSQAIWGLRSFPFPKHSHPVDHRLRDDFVLSPFPALPWKHDWETNPARQQSITAFPMVEQGFDQYRWNDSHFAIASGGLGNRRVPGVDYLFLYWIARMGGLITAAE